MRRRHLISGVALIMATLNYTTDLTYAEVSTSANQTSKEKEQLSSTRDSIDQDNVPDILSSYTTIVSFLIGVSSFVLGLRWSKPVTSGGER